MEAKGQVRAAIKVLGVEVTASGQPKPFAIPTAFLMVGKRPYFVGVKSECERPTGFCGAFTGNGDTLDILNGVTAGNVKVMFNRVPGGTDVSVPLTTRPEELADPRPFLEFLDCLESIASKTLQQSKR